jgi:LPXTG-motif cell wall-anchored protein
MGSGRSDLLGMGIAAVGALGIGGASLMIARRRRNCEVS